jgi:hypothetical protein
MKHARAQAPEETAWTGGVTDTEVEGWLSGAADGWKMEEDVVMGC